METSQPIHHKRLQAILFDLDDTLIDWSKASISWEAAHRQRSDRLYQWLADAGHKLPAAELFAAFINDQIGQVWAEAKREWTGARFDEALHRSFAAFGLETETIDLEEAMRAYGWGVMPGVEPYPDAHAVLDELRRQGYKLGLITNSFLPMWMRDVELAAYNLLPYFPARATSCDTGYMKPHPAIFWRVLGMLHTTAGQAMFVGDRPDHDVLGANQVGMVSVLMDPAHLTRSLNGNQPDHTITSLSQLLPILEGYRP